jgi:hypothetical protein
MMHNIVTWTKVRTSRTSQCTRNEQLLVGMLVLFKMTFLLLLDVQLAPHSQFTRTRRLSNHRLHSVNQFAVWASDVGNGVNHAIAKLARTESRSFTQKLDQIVYYCHLNRFVVVGGPVRADRYKHLISMLSTLSHPPTSTINVTRFEQQIML